MRLAAALLVRAASWALVDGVREVRLDGRSLELRPALFTTARQVPAARRNECPRIAETEFV